MDPDLENRIQIIESTLEEIRVRNTRVSSDKAWETSLVRRGSVALLTYIFATAVMFGIEAGDPFRNALIPVVGYIVSTYSVPFVKSVWLVRRNSK